MMDGSAHTHSHMRATFCSKSDTGHHLAVYQSGVSDCHLELRLGSQQHAGLLVTAIVASTRPAITSLARVESSRLAGWPVCCPTTFWYSLILIVRHCVRAMSGLVATAA